MDAYSGLRGKLALLKELAAVQKDLHRAKAETPAGDAGVLKHLNDQIRLNESQMAHVAKQASLKNAYKDLQKALQGARLADEPAVAAPSPDPFSDFLSAV